MAEKVKVKQSFKFRGKAYRKNSLVFKSDFDEIELDVLRRIGKIYPEEKKVVKNKGYSKK